MLLERFKTGIEERGLLTSGEKVLAAVSGGVDSVVLLDLLNNCASEKRLQILVAHLHHGIRGAEADEDEKFVARLAASYGYNYFTKRVDAPHYAKAHKLSIEAAARELRYNFLNRTALHNGAGVIALGHNADDQAETVLDHLLRGAGLAGLAGMPYKRDNVIRPLLQFRREEIIEYAKEAGLAFREDSTNRDVRYRRNKIRHELLPMLEQYNPQVRDALCRTSRVLDENEEFLRWYATEVIEKIGTEKNDKIILDIPLFLKYLTIIRKYVLFEIADKIGITRYSLSFGTVARLLHLVEKGRSGAKIPLAEDWLAQIHGNSLVFSRQQSISFNVTLKKGETYVHPDLGWTFRSIRVKKEEMESELGGRSTVEFVDEDKIPGDLQLRNWRRGDRFAPIGLKGAKKVADFFVDAKIPGHLRGSIPILTCEKGIIWICGYRLSETFKVTESTSNLLKLEFGESDFRGE